MRIDLVQEGVPYHNWYYYDHGCFTWDERCPFLIGDTIFEEVHVGWATDFQRSADGVISCEIGDIQIREGCGPSFTCTGFEGYVDPTDSTHHVTESKIRVLRVSDLDTIPKIKE